MSKPSVEIGRMVIADSDGMWLAYFQETGQSMADATLLASFQSTLLVAPELQDAFFNLLRVAVANYIHARWGARTSYGPVQKGEEDELPRPVH